MGYNVLLYYRDRNGREGEKELERRGGGEWKMGVRGREEWKKEREGRRRRRIGGTALMLFLRHYRVGERGKEGGNGEERVCFDVIYNYSN
jgi:hypothetical protein